MLGSLLKNLVTSTLPLLFETVVTVIVTLNWEKVTRCHQKVTRSLPLLFVTFASMRSHVYYAIFK